MSSIYDWGLQQNYSALTVIVVPHLELTLDTEVYVCDGTTMKELNNWQDFRVQIASYYNEGLREQEISELFKGKTVNWEGTVKKNQADEQYAKCITLSMGDELVPLQDGNSLRADHLVLPVDDSGIAQWDGCETGDRLSFKAVIGQGGLFGVITLLETTRSSQIVVTVRLSTCQLVENFGKKS